MMVIKTENYTIQHMKKKPNGMRRIGVEGVYRILTPIPYANIFIFLLLLFHRLYMYHGHSE